MSEPAAVPVVYVDVEGTLYPSVEATYRRLLGKVDLAKEIQDAQSRLWTLQNEEGVLDTRVVTLDSLALDRDSNVVVSLAVGMAQGDPDPDPSMTNGHYRRTLRKLRGRRQLEPGETLPLPDWDLEAAAEAPRTRRWFALLRAGLAPRDP